MDNTVTKHCEYFDFDAMRLFFVGIQGLKYVDISVYATLII